MLQCKTLLLEEFYRRQWSRLSLNQLLQVQRVTDLPYWQLDLRTDSF